MIFKLIIIVLLSYFLFRKRYKLEYFNNNSIKTYKRCDNITGIYADVLNDNNINITDNNNWNLYIPCGYNNIEKELKLLNVNNDNQIIFGIDGCDKIVSKINLWRLLKKYYGLEKAKNIMPLTYDLLDKNDIKMFTNNYKSNKLYILKSKKQGKKGLKLTKNLSEILNAKLYNYTLVQEFINNVFLINNRKLNIRLYVFIVSKDGQTDFYIHKRGKCLYTNKNYNNKDISFESNITSYNLDPSVYNNNPLSTNELKNYFDNYNLDYDIMMNKIYNNLNYTTKSIVKELSNLKKIKKNLSCQLFGVDYILDNNLNPYLLEFNKGPNMNHVNKDDYNLKYKVIEDIFSLINLIPNNNNEFVKID